MVQSTIRLIAQQADSATCLKRLLQEEHETVHAFECDENFPNSLKHLGHAVSTIWAQRLLRDLHGTCSSENWVHQVMRADLISDWCRNETRSKELDAEFRLEGRAKSAYRSLASFVHYHRAAEQGMP